jgi:hypothetical protein
MHLDSLKLSDALFRAIRVASKSVKDPKALQILSIAERGYDVPLVNKSRDLLTYAYVNKVLTLLLLQEPKHRLLRNLRARLTQQRRSFLNHLYYVVEKLDACHVDYVVFKTLRPVPETPVDIDVLVESKDEAYSAIACLKRGLRIEVWNEDYYSVGVYIPEFKEFVDFYVKPHVADVVYLDPKALIRNKVYLHVNELGVEMLVPVPMPELEFCSILAHSVVKEGLVTLNDVVSLMAYGLLSDSVELAQWLSRFSLSIAYGEFTKVLERALPARMGYRARLKVLASLLREKYAVSSLPYFISGLGKRLNRVVEQQKKVTYVRGLER